MDAQNEQKEQSIALLEAVIANNLNITQALLEHGTSPNFFEDSARLTPLHFAALYDADTVIPALVMAGGQLDAKSEDDQTPLMIAITHCNDKATEQLIKMACLVTHDTLQ